MKKYKTMQQQIGTRLPKQMAIRAFNSIKRDGRQVQKANLRRGIYD